jgi:ankyrin repeat protein
LFYLISPFLEFHADINVFNDRGEYGIHLAFNAQTVRLFHELGVDVNLRSVTDAGPNITPLHYACTMARGSVVATLIELGADANAPDYYGVRPLEIVVKLRDDEMNRSILKMLLEAGADPCECISGSHLETYLHYVASRGKQNFACMLIEHGADINAMDLVSNSFETHTYDFIVFVTI